MDPVYRCVDNIAAAAWVSLTSIVLCNLLGLERLTNAFGLLCLSRGFSALIGSPVAGKVVYGFLDRMCRGHSR